MKKLSALSTVLAVVFATPVFAIDTCLVGNWVPDPASMQAQFERNPNMGSVQIAGTVIMTLATETGTFNLNGLTIAVQNPGAPLVEVTMNGVGSFAAQADAGQFAFTMGTFDYSAQAQMDMGGTMMNMDIPFSEGMSPMGSGTAGTYTCDATSVMFHANAEGKLIDKWLRQ